MWQWLHDIGWLVGWWRWLSGISPTQATFLATFLGWMVGVFTLVGGALLNACLNRRRDDWLRREDQRAVATALRAELAALRRALTKQTEKLTENLKKEAPPDAGYETLDLSQLVRIMPEMIPKLGLLNQETIQSVMNAYARVEAHYSLLLTVGGCPQPKLSTLRVLWFPLKEVPEVLKLTVRLSEKVQEAISKLDVFLARIR